MSKIFKSFMVVQDPKLANATLTSSDSTGGIQTSVGSISANSSGHLSLFSVGNPSESGSYNLRIQESGNIYEATFAWKNSDLTDSFYHGEPDQRHMVTHEDPWCSDSGSTALPTSASGGKCPGATACFLKSTNTEYIYRTVNPYILQVRSRPVSEDGPKGIYNWTQSNINIQDIAGYGIDSATRADAPLDVASYQDDTIFLVTAFDEELHLYKSTDGVNFDIVCENILSRFGGRRSLIFGLRLAVSGNYIRILFTAYDDLYGKNPQLKLFGFVSTNQGTSFIKTDDGDISPGVWPSTGASRFAYDFASFDENGTFILYNRFNQDSIKGYLAKTTSSFVEYSNLELTGFNVYETLFRPYVCRTQKEFVVLYTVAVKRSPYLFSDNDYRSPKNQVFNEFKKAIIRLDEDPSQTTPIILGQDIIGDYQDGSGMTGFKGCFRHIPLRGKLFQTGSGYSFYASLLGAVDTSPLDVLIFPSTGPTGDIGSLESEVEKLDGESQDFRISSNEITTNSVYIAFQTWDVSPIRDFNLGNMVNYSATQSWPIIHQPKTPLYQPQWNSFVGTPHNHPSFGNHRSPWTRTFGSGSFFSWGSDYLRQIQAINGSRDFFTFIDPTGIGATTRYGANPADFTFGSSVSNWCFIPRAAGASLNIQTFSQPHGASFQWTCRVDVSATSAVGLSFQSYISPSANPFLTDTQFVIGNVNIFNDKAVFYDLNTASSGGTPVPLLTLSPSGYGATPFKDQWWEFRLSSVPWNAFGKDLTSTLFMQLQCRVVGATSWTVSDWFNPSTINPAWDTSLSKLAQKLSFGIFEGNYADKAYWRNVQILRHNNAGQFWINRTPEVGLPESISDRVPVNDIRGKLCTPNPTYLQKGQSVVWGGVGAEQADEYSLSTSFVYDAKNVILPSPRIGYRTGSKVGLTDVNIVFQPSKTNDIFMHDCLGVVNTNCRQIDVAYSNDNISYGPSKTIETDVNNGSIINGNYNSLKVSWAGKTSANQMFEYDAAFNSSDKRSYYIKFDTATGVSGLTLNQRLKIKQNTGQYILLEDDIDLSSISAGTSFTICSDSSFTLFGTTRFGRFMKLTLKDVDLSPDTFGKVGSIIAGVTIPFNTPLNFQIRDSETPTNTTFRSRGAVTWSYKNGPSVRTISANLIGDVYDQLRTTIKNSLRTLVDYDVQPVLLALNSDRNRDPNTFILGRVSGGSDTSADGWYYDEKTLFWRSVGDMSLTVVEVV